MSDGTTEKNEAAAMQQAFPEKNDETHRFILLEPTLTGMTVGIYGLTGIEAVGLLRAALSYAENKMSEQISMVVKHPQPPADGEHTAQSILSDQLRKAQELADEDEPADGET